MGKVKIKNYLSIARFDHASKHIFIIPGLVLGMLLHTSYNISVEKILLGFIAAILIASSNYTINEYFDAPYDKYHPKKKNRPAARGLINKYFMILQYFIFMILGTAISIYIGKIFLFTIFFFILSGILYNIKPFRVKDIPYVDVILESFNNPLRLMLGWGIISDNSIAPVSIIISYWCGGAFLMTAKRLAEMRYMENTNSFKNLIKYRPNFKRYSEKSLSVALFIYAMFSSFNAGVFLIKYRTEYLLLYPLIVAIFAYYLHLTLANDSIVQTPEKLFKNFGLISLLIITSISFIALSYIDISFISKALNLRIPKI